MNEINNLIEMLEKGGFRSACDWFCLKMDTSHLRPLLEEMIEADSALSDPEQKKRFEQGILAIQMSLDGKDKPGSESEAGKASMLVNWNPQSGEPAAPQAHLPSIPVGRVFPENMDRGSTKRIEIVEIRQGDQRDAFGVNIPMKPLVRAGFKPNPKLSVKATKERILLGGKGNSGGRPHLHITHAAILRPI